MSGRLFLIHWEEAEAKALAIPLQEAGWTVEIESQDGAKAGKRFLESPPNAVLIYLTRLPSHGRETALYLRSMKATRDLPIVFVDGNADKVEEVKARIPDAIYTPSSKLEAVLKADHMILGQGLGYYG